MLGFVAPLLLVEKFDINLSDIFSIGILKFVFVCVAMSSVCNAATRTNKLCNFAAVRSERPDIVAVVKRQRFGGRGESRHVVPSDAAQRSAHAAPDPSHTGQ